MRKKYSVSQKNIDGGTQKSSCMCPIALACDEQGLKNVNVNKKQILFSPDIQWSRIVVPLPVRAQRFIKAFDDGRPVKPFKFFLNIPD